MEAAARAHEKYAEVNGERVRFYGHVTLKPAHLWDVEFAKHGFTVADYYRGAITYGGAGLLSRTPIHQLRMAIERFIDLFPKRMTREISDQVITLYRKTASPT